MQMNIPVQQATKINILSATAKPKMRQLKCYMEPGMYDEIALIAQQEGMELSAATRELLVLALRYYKFRRGTLNHELPQNNKTFYCQICSQLTSTRKLHSVAVMYDEYKFCED